MPPARAGGGAKAKGATGRRGSTLGGANGAFVRDPRWVTDVAFKPMKKISDEELEAARKMFFDIDRDGSGSIDCVELGMMLRSLGQNPTEQELKDLIDSVDDGDKDGQIQLREFLKLFTMGLDAKGMGASASEVTNIFSALGGTHTLLTGTSRTRSMLLLASPSLAPRPPPVSPSPDTTARLATSSTLAHLLVLPRRTPRPLLFLDVPDPQATTRTPHRLSHRPTCTPRS
jgi:Ca2+-binding EF-hand superfamily protein